MLRREQLHRFPAGNAVAEQQVEQRRGARGVLQAGGRPAELRAQGPVMPLAAQPGELILPHSVYLSCVCWAPCGISLSQNYSCSAAMQIRWFIESFVKKQGTCTLVMF